MRRDGDVVPRSVHSFGRPPGPLEKVYTSPILFLLNTLKLMPLSSAEFLSVAGEFANLHLLAGIMKAVTTGFTLSGKTLHRFGKVRSVNPNAISTSSSLSSSAVVKVRVGVIDEGASTAESAFNRQSMRVWPAATK